VVGQDDRGGFTEIEVDSSPLGPRKGSYLHCRAERQHEPIWDVVVKVPILVEKSKGSRELTQTESEDETIFVGLRNTEAADHGTGRSIQPVSATSRVQG
jgi:hypothetical protein